MRCHFPQIFELLNSTSMTIPNETTSGETIALAGLLEQACGMGVVGHQFLSLLHATSIPTDIYSIPWPPVEEKSAELRKSAKSKWVFNQSINLVVANPEIALYAKKRFGSAFYNGKYNIINPAWETSVPSPEYLSGLSHFNEIWVHSHYLRDIFSRFYTGPITYTPLPILPPSAELTKPNVVELAADSYLLFCFDFKSCFVRKNPKGAIRAFKRAFLNGKGPILVVKTMNGHLMRDEMNEMVQEASDRSDIRIIDGEMSPSEMSWMMSNCCGYVSLHRSEGYGLTIAEALSLGRPVIATSYSGNMDFCNESNTLLCKYYLTPVTGARFYKNIGIWAEPDLEHASKLMQELWQNRPTFLGKAQTEAKKLIESRSVLNCAKITTQRIFEISALRSVRRMSLDFKDNTISSQENGFALIDKPQQLKLKKICKQLDAELQGLKKRPNAFRSFITFILGGKKDRKRIVRSLEAASGALNVFISQNKGN